MSIDTVKSKHNDHHYEIDRDLYLHTCRIQKEDVNEHTKQMDIQYLRILKSYLDTVSSTEPVLSATPKLSSLLHTYLTKNDKRLQLADYATESTFGRRHSHDREKEPQVAVRWPAVESQLSGFNQTLFCGAK